MDFLAQAGFGASVSIVVGGMLWRRKVGELPTRWRRWADAIELLILALAAGFVLVRSYRNAVSPMPWDFPVFYTVARNAAEGISFYDPEALLRTFTEVERQWNVPPDWLQEVGFWYAPPTALYLAPLGHLAYPAALVVNDLVQGALFVVSILLLHRYFPLRPGPMGVVEMALLGLLFRPVMSAFGLSQIVFGALLAVVLATGTIADRRWVGGFALGIGAVFKHLLLIPAVLVLALRKWRMTVASLIAMLAALLLAGLVLGFDAYREFVSYGPNDRSPRLALNSVIQSLNGAMRRAFDAVPSGPGAVDAIMYLPYLAVAALLTVVTLVVVWLAGRERRAIIPCFALISLLSLIVYPNTLFNTLPLMIPALVVILYQSDDLSLPPWAPVVFVAGVYGALAVHFRFGFLVLIIVWLFLAGALVRVLWRNARTVAA